MSWEIFNGLQKEWIKKINNADWTEKKGWRIKTNVPAHTHTHTHTHILEGHISKELWEPNQGWLDFAWRMCVWECVHMRKSVRRAREFVRGSTNGGMIEKERERERWKEQPGREVWPWHSLRRTSLRRMESLTEGGEDMRRIFWSVVIACGLLVQTLLPVQLHFNQI